MDEPLVPGSTGATVSLRFLVMARMESLLMDEVELGRCPREVGCESCVSRVVVSGCVDTRERLLRSPTEGSQPPVDPGLELLWMDEAGGAALEDSTGVLCDRVTGRLVGLVVAGAVECEWRWLWV